MNDEEKYYEHSRIFKAYVIETPDRDNYGMYKSRNGLYKFVLELVSIKDFGNDEELVLCHFYFDVEVKICYACMPVLL